MRAIDAARKMPRTVPAGTPLHEVARLLATEGLRAVVVTGHDGRPAGIVTERDLVVRGLARKLADDSPVEAVMTSDLVTTDPSAPTRSAYRLLQDRDVRQVPLVESGRLVGIVERDDLADDAAGEVLARLGACPRCGGRSLHAVSTASATNFLCLSCRSCWHLHSGAFVPVETRSCPGCPDHNFCRFPLIDHGADATRFAPSPPDRPHDSGRDPRP